MCATLNIAGKDIDIDPSQSIEEAVRKSGYLPDAYIFTLDGRPVPMDTQITDSMNIMAIKVASGG